MFNQTSLYLIWSYGTHQSLESIRGGTAVGAIGKKTEVTCPIVGKLTHIGIILTSANVRQQSDCQQV